MLRPIDTFARVAVLAHRVGLAFVGAPYDRARALVAAGERDPAAVLAEVLAAHNASIGLPAPAPLGAVFGPHVG